MRVCLDTNVLVQILPPTHPFHPIARALLRGEVELAVSTGILLEYEEIVSRLGGRATWHRTEEFLQRMFAVHGNILFVDPRFSFNAIPADPDDSKFADCAIAAQADFIVTEDVHFDALRQSGYRPQPIAPSDFINQHLTQGN